MASSSDITTTPDDLFPSVRGTIPKMGVGVQVDQYAEWSRNFSAQHVEEFGSLVHDFNPIHYRPASSIDEKEHNDVIVPGIMVASMFSSIFANLAPGCIYKKQSLQFWNPVYADDDWVLGRIQIKRMRSTWTKGSEKAGDAAGGVLVECDTSIWKTASATQSSASLEESSMENKTGDKVITGSAMVWLPNGSKGGEMDDSWERPLCV